jgi:hypothetical protein
MVLSLSKNSLHDNRDGDSDWRAEAGPPSLWERPPT